MNLSLPQKICISSRNPQAQTQGRSPGLRFAQNSQAIPYSNLPGMELFTPTHVVLFSFFVLSLTYIFRLIFHVHSSNPPSPHLTDNSSRTLNHSLSNSARCSPQFLSLLPSCILFCPRALSKAPLPSHMHSVPDLKPH